MTGASASASVLLIYSGLISFRTDWFDLLAVQGTLKSLLLHHNLKASVLQRSAFFMVQFSHPYMTIGKTMAQIVEVSACNAGDLSLVPGSGRSPGEGNGNPLQYSCLENSMDGGAWWATVHGVIESDATKRLHFSFFHFSFFD